MAANPVGVVVLGCRNVGAAVLRRLAAGSAFHQERYALDFQLRAVGDSSGCVVAPSDGPGLDANSVLAFKDSGKLASHPQGVANGPALEEALANLAGSRTIVVDCTAEDSVTPLLKTCLTNGGGVVMANKKPMTGPQADFDEMNAPAKLARCQYESAVGAGTPFVATTRRLAASGDTVHSAEGTFSGTLGFITSGLHERPFGDLVNEAYSLGYTEPDPRDDLSGTDVARKALILARCLGWKLEMSDVNIEPLYPPELADVSTEDFLTRIHESNASYAEANEKAAAEGCVLRYVANLEGGACAVGLKAVPATSPIGALSGTDNILQLNSEVYNTTPLVVQGSGAGADVTALGVITDMVNIASAW